MVSLFWHSNLYWHSNLLWSKTLKERQMSPLLNLPMHLVHAALQQSRKLWVRVIIIGSLALIGLGIARIGTVFLPANLTG